MDPSLSQAYLGLTIVLPITLLALVSLAVALLAAAFVALGIARGVKGLLVFFTLVSAGGVVWALRRLRRILLRHRPPAAEGPLPALIAAGAGADRLGAKAWRLGRLAGELPVAPAYVLTTDVYRAQLRRAPPRAGEAPAQYFGRAVPTPGSLRRVVRWAQGVPAERFIVRSSFGGEDGGGAEEGEGSGPLFPGVFESLIWSRDTGARGLAEVLTRVWGSRWGPRAQAYGALPEGLDADLAVLIMPYIPAAIAGVGASVDPATGDGLLQVVECPGGRVHRDLRTGLVSSPEGASAGPLSEALVVAIARLLVLGEARVGAPVEAEWALDTHGRLWIHQVRRLAGLPAVRTLLGDGPAILPARPLTPLTRDILLGEGGALLARALPGGLPASAILTREGMTYLDVAALKGALSPRLRRWAGMGRALSLIARGARPLPRVGGLAGLKGLEGLMGLRERHLLPLKAAQVAVGTLMASAPKAAGVGPLMADPHPEGSRFELRGRRPGGVAPAAVPLWPLGARREGISARIALVVDRAAALVAELGEALGARLGGDVDGIHFLHLRELEALNAGGDPAPLLAAIPGRRRAFEDALSQPHPPVRLEDPAGRVLPRLRPAAAGSFRGVALGTGIVEGIVYRSQGGEGAPPGCILLIEDANQRHFGELLGAAGVIFARGGALSHLALLCRERGLPAIVGAWEAWEALRTGDTVRLDGVAGCVSPIGGADVL